MNEQTIAGLFSACGLGEPMTSYAPLPNHYVALAIDVFEQRPDVIERAARQRLAAEVCTRPGLWPDSDLSLSLVPITAATACLLDPARKAAYDAALASCLQGEPAPPGLWHQQEAPQWMCLPDGHTELWKSYLKKANREDRLGRLVLALSALALAVGLVLSVPGYPIRSAAQWDSVPTCTDTSTVGAAEASPQDDFAEEPLPLPAPAEDPNP